MKLSLRIAQRHAVQVERIREAHVEGRGQPELLANAHRQHAAVHEHGASAIAGRRSRMMASARGSWIEYRCIAGNRQMACRPQRSAICARSSARLFQRIDHGVSEEPVGKAPRRRSLPMLHRPARWRSAPRAPRRGRPARPPRRAPVPPGLRRAAPSPAASATCSGGLSALVPQASKRTSAKRSARARRRRKVTPRCLHRVCSSE